ARCRAGRAIQRTARHRHAVVPPRPVGDADGEFAADAPARGDQCTRATRERIDRQHDGPALATLAVRDRAPEHRRRAGGLREPRPAGRAPVIGLLLEALREQQGENRSGELHESCLLLRDHHHRSSFVMANAIETRLLMMMTYMPSRSCSAVMSPPRVLDNPTPEACAACRACLPSMILTTRRWADQHRGSRSLAESSDV